MDLGAIGEMSTSYASAKLSNQVGVAMLSKALDAQEVQADGIKKMMEQSVMPGVGGNFDASV